VEGSSFTVARASVCAMITHCLFAFARGGRRVGLVLGPTRAQRIVALAQRPPPPSALGDGCRPKWHSIRCESVATRTRRSIAALERIWPDRRAGHGAVRRVSDCVVAGVGARQIERATWTTWLDSAAWEVRQPARGDALVPLGGVGIGRSGRLLMEARVPRSARRAIRSSVEGDQSLGARHLCSAEGVAGAGTRQ